MFGTTFSFWRRLAGKTATTATDTDRRLWVRYPADWETNVEPVERPALENRVSAQVRDISLGGANLLVDRPFDAGQMLTIEIPRAERADSHTVLACVVRAVAEADGRWALGCVFSRELTEADMEGFRERKGQAPPEQRTWTRFPTKLKASCQKIGDQENSTLSAQVINLSASGVGLEVTAIVESGALLSVDLITEDGKVARTILACVVHVTSQSSGVWALGCNFIRELSEEELEALI